ncbi:cb-type cytochrome c oxidase subunit IV [Campylobacter jejuni subsp. jejuni 414]|nr:cb-type cytochrome c oxidase subunit IV [Campylobacter jejuni subsp. jejuni 414]
MHNFHNSSHLFFLFYINDTNMYTILSTKTSQVQKNHNLGKSPTHVFELLLNQV